MPEKIENASATADVSEFPADITSVIDLTTGKVLRRVAQDPGPGDYVADGCRYIFPAEAWGHQIRFYWPDLSDTMRMIFGSDAEEE